MTTFGTGTAFDAPHTPALQSFGNNMRRYTAFYMGYLTFSKATSARILSEMDTQPAYVPLGEVEMLEYERGRVDYFRAQHDSLKDGSDFGTEWSVVILATCVETYLQDVLAFCARLDPQLMGEARPTATLAEVRAAPSVDALAEELYAKWARSWVDDGGPQRWISRLERMGARGFAPDLAGDLEDIWGIRHIVVHRAGRVTPDFVRRHPHMQVAAGEQVNVRDDLVSYTRRATEFVVTTDRFFTARYRIGA